MKKKKCYITPEIYRRLYNDEQSYIEFFKMVTHHYNNFNKIIKISKKRRQLSLHDWVTLINAYEFIAPLYGDLNENLLKLKGQL